MYTLSYAWTGLSISGKALPKVLWNPWLVLGVLLLILALVLLILYTAQQVISYAKSKMKKIEDRTYEKNSVYVLTRNNSSNFGDVFYVGRTNNPQRRNTEHKSKNGLMHIVFESLNDGGARAYEQGLLSACIVEGLITLGQGASNIRREISVKNIKKFKDKLRGLADLIKCKGEEDIYHLCGGK